MNDKELLFSLVRSSIWGGKPDIDEIPQDLIKPLLLLAQKQTVKGLVAEALMRSGIRLYREDAYNVFNFHRELSRTNFRMFEMVKALCRLLESHGIRFCVVKGQTISALYRVCDMRTPGDIDFYCDASSFEQAKHILQEQWQVEFEEEDEDGEQHLAFTYQGVLFEMHYRLMHFASASNQKIFDDYLHSIPYHHLLIDDVRVPTLSPELNVVYTFLHLYHHLVEMGVALRQFCDVAILLNHYQLNTAILKEMLARLGFLRAFTAVGTILVDHLGLPERQFPFPITKKDRHYSRLILDIVFKHGNFGKYNRKYASRSGVAYYFESFFIKLSHYRKLFSLSSKENKAVLFYSIPRKIKLSFQRLQKSSSVFDKA
ncbi:MAG: nucleotidyltransferase family protein [Prevotella sp.]|nr:nucleotidyltransferase family protein [Prevotella sp.]MDY2633676.1 nucleotidyltransferase family protein [Prevotella sp.]